MIRDIPESDRPMERLIKHGVKHLTDSELLASILRSGTKSRSSLDLAHKMLDKVGGITGLSKLSLNELTSFEGIGKVKASQILSAFELARRTRKPAEIVDARIKTPADIVDFFRYQLGTEEVEKFVIVSLSTSKVVIGWDEISSGTLNSSVVHPREVYKSAIRKCADSVIAIHNHPSGSLSPSAEDFLVTKMLDNAGKIVGIKFLDHLIVTSYGYYSFDENGHIVKQ